MQPGQSFKRISLKYNVTMASSFYQYLSACWVFLAALLSVPVSFPSYGIFCANFSLGDFFEKLWILFIRSLLFIYSICVFGHLWFFVWMKSEVCDLVVKFYNLTKIIISYTETVSRLHSSAYSDSFIWKQFSQHFMKLLIKHFDFFLIS